MASRLAVFSLLVFAFSAVAGCSGSLRDYSMVSPVSSADCAFEDSDVRLKVAIVKDRKFGLVLVNKTDKPLRITWGNSTVVAGSGTEEPLAYALLPPGRDEGKSVLTPVAPGGTLSAEVYPASHVAGDGKGGQVVHPLYYKGSGEAGPKSLAGKVIGINLVVEVNDHTRLYPLMVRVERRSFLGLPR